MKKLRGPILTVMGLFILFIVIGSFTDLKLSQAVFSKNNIIGLFLAAAGLIPGYGIGAFMCGVFFDQVKNRNLSLVKKIILSILMVVFFVVVDYFSSEDIFSVNGFYHPEYEHYAMIIAFPFMYLYAFFGYKAAKDSKRQDLVKCAGIVFAAMLIILVAGTIGLKVLVRRPRFRTVTRNIVPFYPWWKKCSNYREIMTAANILSDEFKSFPSGHTSVAALTMLFPVVLPVFYPEKQNKVLKWFICGAVYALVIGFSRILVGAHYLSDVGMGGLIAIVGICIVNEIYIGLNTKG